MLEWSRISSTQHVEQLPPHKHQEEKKTWRRAKSHLKDVQPKESK